MAKGNKRNKSVFPSKLKTRDNIITVAVTFLVAIAAYITYDNALQKELPPPVLSPSKNSAEKNIPRIEWLPEKKFASFLEMKGSPVILRNSVATTFPKWTIAQIADLAQFDPLSGFYQSDTGFFGPYYDPTKPMHKLSSVQQPLSYLENVSLSKDEIVEAFSKQSPIYALSASLADINRELEDMLQLEELVALMPARSSVNMWLGSPGGVTPCHFDGYHNMYNLTTPYHVMPCRECEIY